MPDWQQKLLAALAKVPDGGFVVFDVDWTVSNGLAGVDARSRPGMDAVLSELHARSVTIHFWSGGGAKHAQEVAAVCGFAHFVSGFSDKADWPMQEDTALAVLGRKPDLTIDDCADEAVSGWNFHLIEAWCPAPEPLG